jgi:exodeoxyribonuclease V beta subunit
LKPLNPILLPLEGDTLIEASAGTGKTYTLASLYLRLIGSGIPIDKILVVTFTEAATAELRERLRDRLWRAREALNLLTARDETEGSFLRFSRPEQKQYRQNFEIALRCFDEASIYTIHSFCLRVLQEYAFESGALYDVSLATDPHPLYQEIAADFWAKEAYGLGMPFVRYLIDKKVDLDQMEHLVKLVGDTPEQTIIPDSCVTTNWQDVFFALYQRARRIWLENQSDIENLLKTHPGVNRRSYNKKRLRQWLDNTGRFLAPESPERLEDPKGIDQFTASRLKAKQNPKAEGPPAHPFFEACEALYKFPPAWLAAFKQQLMRFATKELKKRKTQHHVQYFNDLIVNLGDALKKKGNRQLKEKIDQRYRAVLIDEFQDTDQLQYRIFKQLFGGRQAPFFMIGDPKQSIYSFRGADVFAYLQASRTLGGRMYTLNINWRSDPGLVKAINTLFKNVPDPFLLSNMPYSEVAASETSADRLRAKGQAAAPLQIRFFARPDSQPETPPMLSKAWALENVPAMASADIADLLDGRFRLEADTETYLVPRDIAVLVRTHRQARLMQQALKKVNVPSVLTSKESVMNSPEAMELWRILSAIADPGSETKIKAALTTDFFGLTGNDLYRLMESAGQWDEWLTLFQQWHRLWRHQGFIQMIYAVYESRPLDAPLSLLSSQLRYEDGDRRLTNFQHLAELLHLSGSSQRIGLNGLLRWFEKRMHGRRRESEEEELRLESDADAVSILTIHKSKGLEFPVVYLPYLWDGKIHAAASHEVIFHDPTQHFTPTIDLGSSQIDDHRQMAVKEELAENLRLLYVALTRARHLCLVSWGAVKDMPRSALAYLLHHPGSPCDLTGLWEHVQSLSDADLHSDLKGLAAASQGTIQIIDYAALSPGAYQPEQRLPGQFSYRQFSGSLAPLWQTTSFSEMISVASKTDVTAADDPFWEEATLEAKDSRALIRSWEGKTEKDPAVALAAFDRGARAGNCFHTILESVDLQSDDADALQRLVAEKLALFRYDPQKWAPTLTHAVTDISKTVLDPEMPDLTLGAISLQAQFREFEFVFPVLDKVNAQNPAFFSSRIAEVIKHFGGAKVTESYLDQLSELHFQAIKGYLKGFVDLVFNYYGRWYIVDYKSNHLGDREEDYGKMHLCDSMAQHHYYLQYYLYTVALHRYLMYRDPNYDYRSHFGKVYYLYLRGMSPQYKAGHGVFQDRPPYALIDALSSLFEKGDA